MKFFALTHPGTRKRNEDRHLINEIDNGAFLLAVADGVGGEVAGDHAAEIVVQKLETLHAIPVSSEQCLISLVMEASAHIQGEVKKKPELEGMATTVTGVLISGENAYWVHVGDSRIYVFSKSRLTQITKDQNWAQFLVDDGQITADEARTQPLRNMLDQCVGCGDVNPVTGHFRLKKGDQLMLSTDGLHAELTPEIITSHLKAEKNLKDKAAALVNDALENGGGDNITVLLAEI